MQLIIMRHGQAVPHASADHLRPLTEKGHKDAANMGRWLLQHAYQPDIVLVSPYLRAQQTAAEVLAHVSGWCREDAEWITPEDVPQQVIRMLNARSESAIMIVSHQPLVGSLLASLVDEKTAFDIDFVPSTLVVLEGEMMVSGAMRLIAVAQP